MPWFARTAVTQPNSSGGQKSDIRVCAGLAPSAGSERESGPSPASGGHQPPLAFPGCESTSLWSLPLSSQGLLPSACLCPASSLLMRTQSLHHVLCTQSPSPVGRFATPWTGAHQALLSLKFPGQEYWSGLPFASPGDLPDPGIEPTSPALAGRFFTPAPPRKPIIGSGPT